MLIAEASVHDLKIRKIVVEKWTLSLKKITNKLEHKCRSLRILYPGDPKAI